MWKLTIHFSQVSFPRDALVLSLGPRQLLLADVVQVPGAGPQEVGGDLGGRGWGDAGLVDALRRSVVFAESGNGKILSLKFYRPSLV